MKNRLMAALVMGLVIPLFLGTASLAADEIVQGKLIGLKVTSGKTNANLEGTHHWRSFGLDDFESDSGRGEYVGQGAVTMDCCASGGFGAWTATIGQVLNSDGTVETGGTGGGSYSVNSDGSFSLTDMGNDPGPGLTGYLSANNNVAVMSGGEAGEEGISQELVISLRKPERPLSNADLVGRYHFRDLEMHHDDGKVCWGELSFDGQGTVQGAATCFWSDGTLEDDSPENQLGPFSYTVHQDGSVEIPIPEISPDAKMTGHLSADGQVLVATLAHYDSQQQYVFQFLITALKEDLNRTFDNADLDGAYRLAGLQFYDFETPEREASLINATVTFDGIGSWSASYTGFESDGATETGSTSGPYRVHADGSFVLTEPAGNGGGSWTGHLSTDGEMIIMARGNAPNSIRGRVKDEYGRPLGGITVELLQDNGDPNNGGQDAWDPVAQQDTDSQGYYQFNDVPSRTYHLHIHGGETAGCGSSAEADLHDVQVIDGAATYDQDFQLDNGLPDYFPLTVGNRWIYHPSYGDQGDRVDRIVGKEIVDGVVTYVLNRREAPDDNYYENRWLARDGCEVKALQIWGNEGDMGSPVQLEPPWTHVTQDPAVDDTWGNQITVGSHTYRFTATVESLSDTVSVPAGVFSNCVRVRVLEEQISGSGTNHKYRKQWFAPDVGPVLYKSYDEDWSSETFKQELIEYTIQGSDLEVVNLSDYFFHSSPNPGDSLTYSYVDPTGADDYTVTFTQLDSGPNAGKFRAGDWVTYHPIEVEWWVFDTPGGEVVVYERNGEPFDPPGILGAHELNCFESCAVFLEGIGSSKKWYIRKQDRITVPAGTFYDVLVLFDIDMGHVRNKANDDYGLPQDEVQNALTHVTWYARGIGRVKDIEIVSATGEQIHDYELKSTNFFSSPESCTASATAGTGGSISPSGAVLLGAGQCREFDMTPDAGYEVEDVLVDGESVGGVTTYTLCCELNDPQPHSIEVLFATRTYTIRASADPGGTVTPSGEASVPHGSSKAYTIDPEDGYDIQGLVVDGIWVGPAGQYTFGNVTSDHTLHAVFINLEGPSVEIASPEEDFSTEQLLFVGGTASQGGSPVSRVALQITGGGYYITQDHGLSTKPTWVLAVGTQSWRFDTSLVNWTPGQEPVTYTVIAKATDEAGNMETSSVGFTAVPRQKAYTDILLDLSSQTIASSSSVSVSGKLTRLPDTGPLSGMTITLFLTAPNGTNPTYTSTTSTDASGGYGFDGISAFVETGIYKIQARFDGTDTLEPSDSEVKMVKAGPSAGYAILVQGRISGDNAVASHDKTVHRVYGRLKNRNLSDADIFYFSDSQQEGSDALLSKDAIKSAVESWAADKISASPAPLWVILEGPADEDTLYLGDETISSADLSLWLDNLESTVGMANPGALSEKRIVAIGACYAGSFIPNLSREGRVIVAGAAGDEASYQGPAEPDGVRSAEFFFEELFERLERGESLKGAFVAATERIEIFTRKGGEGTYTPSRYFDAALQHPLLQDDYTCLDNDGVCKGSNVLSDGHGNGQAADSIYLGTGPNYDAGAQDNPAEVLSVTETVYLSASETQKSALMWAMNKNMDRQTTETWLEVRVPSKMLSGEEGSKVQLEVVLDRETLALNQSEDRWEMTYSAFEEPGRYEVFYFTQDEQTAEVSPLKRSVVYKNKVGNQPPSGFELISPVDGSRQKTALVFDWGESLDPDGDGVTYNLVLATDADFTNVVFRKQEIPTSTTHVERSAGLDDLTAFYWKVEAVDWYGAVTSSHAAETLTTLAKAPHGYGFVTLGDENASFSTDNTNGFPGFIRGRVYNAQDYWPIEGAEVSTDMGTSGVSSEQGVFIMVVPAGTFTVSCSASGYGETAISQVSVSGLGSIIVNFEMQPAGTGTPTFSPEPDTYREKKSIQISSQTHGAAIHYTTEGSEPTESSPVYGSPIELATSILLKAKAFQTGSSSSETAAGVYTLNLAGDINRDYAIDLSDAVAALQVLSGFLPVSGIHQAADVNGDGKIGMAEALFICRKISELE